MLTNSRLKGTMIASRCTINLLHLIVLPVFDYPLHDECVRSEAVPAVNSAQDPFSSGLLSIKEKL